jgi:GABA permease
MRQILIVANQTLGGERLMEVVRDRIAHGPCTFTLVVPVVPAAGDLAVTVGAGLTIQASSPTYEAARVEAVHRLGAGLQALSDLGATVDGDVGVQNPVEAVGHCLKLQAYDEIIVSTLPKTVSRWLHQDVPHRIRRKFEIPVAVVTAREPMAT